MKSPGKIIISSQPSGQTDSVHCVISTVCPSKISHLNLILRIKHSNIQGYSLKSCLKARNKQAIKYFVQLLCADIEKQTLFNLFSSILLKVFKTGKMVNLWPHSFCLLRSFKSSLFFSQGTPLRIPSWSWTCDPPASGSKVWDHRHVAHGPSFFTSLWWFDYSKSLRVNGCFR